MSRDLALWTVVLAGPTVWLCSFEANFALAPWACTFQSKAALYLVSFAALALCAASLVWAWRLWRQLGAEWNAEGGGAVPRGRAMAISGVVLSGGFLIVVLAQAIPELMLESCQ
jgi:hypothetical protein